MTILDEIIGHTRADLEISRLRLPEARLRELAVARPAALDFAAALRPRGDGQPRVIAELKRASPSKGLIRPEFGVVSLACDLEAHGAAALSVLTEVRYFRGSPEYLRAVVANVSIPVLRKDFIVDSYQVYEARAWGASAILLIAAALEPAEFVRLHRLAEALDLSVLAEVHHRDELDWVLASGARIVGINSRDLRTFKTDLATTEALLGQLPRDVIGVAESAIRDGADMARLTAAGAKAFLIGETLMRAPSPGGKLQELINDAARLTNPGATA